MIMDVLFLGFNHKDMGNRHCRPTLLLRIVCIGYTKFPFLRHSIRKSTQSLQSLIVNEGPHCSPSYSHMFECADFTPG